VQFLVDNFESFIQGRPASRSKPLTLQLGIPLRINHRRTVKRRKAASAIVMAARRAQEKGQDEEEVDDEMIQHVQATLVVNSSRRDRVPLRVLSHRKVVQ